MNIYGKPLLRCCVAASLWSAAVATQAQEAATDSLQVADLQEVVVRGVKARANAPFAVSEIREAALADFGRSGVELPFLLAQTPGIVAWSEGGLGVGTTAMRLRGADDSRINVTLDGVGLNAPEDACVFWANMNAYASLLGGVQIQRGVGTSTNGDGAFGGCIALTSRAAATKPWAEVRSSVGSYGTWHGGAQFSTGLMGQHLILEGAFGHSATDGFIHGTGGHSGSYMAALTWREPTWQLTYRNLGNYEHTGLAWNGVSVASAADGSPASYADLWRAGLGRYNDLYERLEADGTTMTRYTLADGTLWRGATDNFHQNHNFLAFSWQPSAHWSASATLHYTYGYGYYEELKPDCKVSKFGLVLQPSRTDLIRQKGVEQQVGGLVAHADYTSTPLDAVFGMALQTFSGDHFGYLTYAADEGIRHTLLADGRYTYYRSDATKTDGNVYGKLTWKLTPTFDLFADLQYRYVHYVIAGCNDKFLPTEDGGYTPQRLDVDQTFHFFNPKGGLAYHNGPHHAYASVAVSHREPKRDNYTDNGVYPAPRPERLTDYEVGYDYRTARLALGIGAYYMHYTDQFVQTGAVSDIGEPLTTNIPASYRLGLEVTARYEVLPTLTLSASAAISRSCLTDFDEVVEDYTQGLRTVHYDHATLAFSPAVLLGGFATWHKGGWQATWHTAYVSRQYLDNTATRERSLPAYSQSDATLDYTFSLRRCPALRAITLGVQVSNIFDAHYAASGWTYSATDESNGYDLSHRISSVGYMPMAGRRFMASLRLRF